ncbi:MAG: RND transporter [Candidatus Binatia bacterium]|nr:MAG: RND transporter [Candidatus Binatia bacterium]
MSDQTRRRFAGWVATVALLSSCHAPSSDKQSQQPAAPVSVAPVERREVARLVKAIGRVESLHVVRVVPQVDGQLLSVHFAEGDHVAAGALLFRIDPRPFENLLRQREAMLERDLADLRVAEAEARRRASLLEQGFVSREENEQAQARAATLRAAVAADRAALADAKLQLSYCSIYAPVTGRLGQLLVHPGNVVKKNETTLVTIQQMHPIRVAFTIREADLPQVLSQSAKGTLFADARPSADGGPVLRGRVEFIDNQVDRATGTVLLKASFDNQSEVLWPGQFVPIELEIDRVPGALLIPRVALQTGQEGPFVFILEGDQTVRVRPVEVAFETAGHVVVRGGVRPGEWVVTEGQFRLTDGARVEVKRREQLESTQEDQRPQ